MLGLPPAFNLSHDQTLQFKSFCHSTRWRNNGSITQITLNKLMSHLINRTKYFLHSLPTTKDWFGSFILPDKCPHELSEFFFKDHSSAHFVKRRLGGLFSLGEPFRSSPSEVAILRFRLSLSSVSAVTPAKSNGLTLIAKTPVVAKDNWGSLISAWR